MTPETDEALLDAAWGSCYTTATFGDDGDGTVAIAPERAGMLLEQVRARQRQDRFLSPPSRGPNAAGQ